MIRAAGIMFITADGRCLLLKRGQGGDHPDEWCWPGGRIEGDETPEAAAIRETMEEAGYDVAPADLRPHTRSISPIAGPGPSAMPPAGEASLPTADPAGVPVITEEVDFTTFVVRVAEPFMPVLNDEHVGFAWCAIDTPPLPLHPGALVAIERLGADELGVARMMAAGQLTSPQVYMNVTLWDLRITGTGVAYRQGKDEFVLRGPEDYLTDEFLARCNGLAVIFEHPKAAKLNSKEFADRVIGAVLLPYIKGDEVWGIAKVYDDDANSVMRAGPISTSPGVILNMDPDANPRFKLEDGSVLLIEGKPALLDHVAICPLGVWDKGGDPSGVRMDSQAAPSPRLNPAKLRQLHAGVALLDMNVRSQSARVGR